MLMHIAGPLVVTGNLFHVCRHRDLHCKPRFSLMDGTNLAVRNCGDAMKSSPIGDIYAASPVLTQSHVAEEDERLKAIK